MVALELSLEGEVQLQRYLGVVADGIKDWREPLKASAAELQKSFQLNFDARGALFGGWSPRKVDKPWPLLEKTGTMRHSFYDTVTRDTLTLGNKTPYFPFHQSNQPRTKLPRRVMMAIDATRALFIVKSFQAYINSVIRSGQ